MSYEITFLSVSVFEHENFIQKTIVAAVVDVFVKRIICILLLATPPNANAFKSHTCCTLLSTLIAFNK